MSEGFNSKQWTANRANFDRNLVVVIGVDLYNKQQSKFSHNHILARGDRTSDNDLCIGKVKLLRFKRMKRSLTLVLLPFLLSQGVALTPRQPVECERQRHKRTDGCFLHALS